MRTILIWQFLIMASFFIHLSTWERLPWCYSYLLPLSACMPMGIVIRQKNFNFGLNIGYLIFNPKMLD